MNVLLAINHAYLLWGTSIYMGVLWGMKFFWFPTWSSLNTGNYYEHIIPQTTAGTKFFTPVVSLMFITNIVMIISEWGTRFAWVPWVAMACVSLATIWGTMQIIPINKRLAARVTDSAEFTGLLKKWLALNTMRWVVMTIMWLVLIYYFIAKGNLLPVLAGEC